MSLWDTLEKIVEGLPEERVREVLDFAEFLSWREEREACRQFGPAQFARAYGPNELEYSLSDLKRVPNP
jgi:Protein of unknown function (DUF2281)